MSYFKWDVQMGVYIITFLNAFFTILSNFLIGKISKTVECQGGDYIMKPS